MLKRTLVILVLALAQVLCSIDDGEAKYKFKPLTC